MRRMTKPNKRSDWLTKKNACAQGQRARCARNLGCAMYLRRCPFSRHLNARPCHSPNLHTRPLRLVKFCSAVVETAYGHFLECTVFNFAGGTSRAQGSRHKRDRQFLRVIISCHGQLFYYVYNQSKHCREILNCTEGALFVYYPNIAGSTAQTEYT